MAYDTSNYARFPEDFGDVKFSTPISGRPLKHPYHLDMTKMSGYGYKFLPETVPGSLKARVLSRVFMEDYERKILNPQGPIVHCWNKIFLVACVVSLFVDPLFFYLPRTNDKGCLLIKFHTEIALTVVRSFADMFYWFKIFVRFRTAFVAPSSRVFGRGELVVDPSKISSRYLSKDFWIDLIAALPLPQVLIWFVTPYLKGSTMENTKEVLWFFILFQYIPRLFLVFPLATKIVNATGVMTETAWAGAAYNLMLFMLASHVLGSTWYLLSIDRMGSCWKAVCELEKPSCQSEFFDCKSESASRDMWFQSSNITGLCNPSSSFYNFGIFGEAVDMGITSEPFHQKYAYCLWWGLKNLSSLGQGLATSAAVGEICFAVLVSILGLVLFALLIGNMQSFLQSTTIRLEEWRIKITDTEHWMHLRHLPPELRHLVRKYDQYKWIATQGVDEEGLLRGLPLDLRRDIKRHLCLNLVRRVPLFEEMDEVMLDAICERLKPALYTRGTCLVREMDPVNEMLFIIRGHLDSYTTNGGRTGFFNSCRIGPGDFCGEELLTWALYPRPAVNNLPSSTRTVKAISEVEAFALVAEDLNFVNLQFRRRLLSNKIKHRFRFHSPQWRTWAACCIQAAWIRMKRRRASVAELIEEEPVDDDDIIVDVENEAGEAPGEGPPAPGSVGMAGKFVQRLVANTMTKRRQVETSSRKNSSVVSLPLQKPTEPDFSSEEDRRID